MRAMTDEELIKELVNACHEARLFLIATGPNLNVGREDWQKRDELLSALVWAEVKGKARLEGVNNPVLEEGDLEP